MRRLMAFTSMIVLGVAIAWAIRSQFQPKIAKASPVPNGDIEIAWIHTTTNGPTWERFVKGVFEAAQRNPQLIVDDSAAFLDQTASVPEVVISFRDQPGRIRIRWYKLSNEVSIDEWVNKLAERSPPPIAFIGGSSTDRAIDLANALSNQTDWQGPTPLLCLTTATAEEAIANTTGAKSRDGTKLMKLHDGRTFRFCFSNKAMTKAVLDFVGQNPAYRPHSPMIPPYLVSTLGAHFAWNGISTLPILNEEPPSKAYILSWKDEPYSHDLAQQFSNILQEKNVPNLSKTMVSIHPIRSSVGTLNQVNKAEREVTSLILDDGWINRGERVLVVLPAATQPTRRVIRELSSNAPFVGRSMVAVTGDGVSFNTVFRDGDVAWPIRELTIPFVFFAHQNPVAWDAADQSPTSTRTSTDDVLLFMDITRILVKHIKQLGQGANADDLLKLFHADPFFNAEGERASGEGEYIVVVSPVFHADGRIDKTALFEVHTRGKDNTWLPVRNLSK